MNTFRTVTSAETFPSPLITPTLSEKDKKKAQIDFQLPDNVNQQNNFNSCSYVIVSPISQGIRQCAGISVAAVKEFHENSLIVDELNKNEIAKRIRDDGAKFYGIGKENEPTEVGQDLSEGYIELKAIYSRRTQDFRNENKTLRLRFQTAFSVLAYQEKYHEMPDDDNTVLE